MKKSTFLFLSMAFSGISLLAQPTLTASGMNPVIGDVITYHICNYVSPGSSGANQTWNLALTSNSVPTITGVAPSSSPYASSFTQSSVGFNNSGTWAFYNGTASALQNNGIATAAGTVMSYSNPEDLLRFPFTYNNSYTDAWAVTYLQATYTYYRTGTTTVTADGYGTLTTPDGTFSNVTRVHFYQSYQDSVNIMNNPVVITYINDEYIWYLNGNHYAVAAVFTLTPSTGSPIQQGFYLDGVVSGINENSVLNSLALAPNPANDELNFNLNLNSGNEIQISVFNTAGQEVLTPVSAFATTGENRIAISVAELPAGIYFAKISVDGEAIKNERIVVAH